MKIPKKDITMQNTFPYVQMTYSARSKRYPTAAFLLTWVVRQNIHTYIYKISIIQNEDMFDAKVTLSN